jgi:hypothetical protein
LKPVAIEIPHKEWILAPAACLHWPIGERDLMQQWVDAVRSRPNCYTILMGDTTDFARTHYRRHLKSYVDDENSQEAIDGYIREEVGKLAKVLEPIKSRIWGVVRGNHYHEFLDMTNSEQELCRTLGLRYLGALGALRVTFPQNGNTRRSIQIFAHHSGGSKGARTTGGDVSGAQRNELAWDADVYLTAHTHRRWANKESVMRLTDSGDPKVVERTKVFVRCGAFLKGFREDHPTATQPHRPSYAEEAAFRATDLGWVEVRVKWRYQGKRGEQVAYPEYQLVI